MKKYIAFIITIIMSVSIISCSGSTNKGAEPSIGDQMYEKYKSIIDKLEGENYDGAIEEIQTMKPAPVIQEVGITADNFFDYYDIVYRENNIERDSDGKITRIDKYDNMFEFKLKDEYSLDPDEDNTVEIGVTCEYDLKKIENVNFETGEITLNDENYDELEKKVCSDHDSWTTGGLASLSVTCKGSNTILCNETPTIIGPLWYGPESDSYNYGHNYSFSGITPDDHEGYVFVPADIHITRAEGTLHIVNK